MDKLKNLPPQHKLLVGVGFMGLLAGAVYYLMIMSTDDLIAGQRQLLQAAQTQLQKEGQTDFVKEQARLEKKKKKLEDYVKNLKAYMLATRDAQDIFDDLLTAESVSGVEILGKEMGDKAESEDGEYLQIELQAEVKGSYPDLMKFFVLLAMNRDRMLHVKDVSLQAMEARSQRGKEVKVKTRLVDGVPLAESQLIAKFSVRGYASAEKEAKAEAAKTAKQ